MRFQIVYPGVSTIDCRDCQKYVYDLDYGNKVVDEDINEFIERDGPPPCSSCPKGEIDLDGKRLGLDPRNERLYQLFKEVKIAGSAAIPLHLNDCPVFYESLVIVDEVSKSAKEVYKARVMKAARGET